MGSGHPEFGVPWVEGVLSEQRGEGVMSDQQMPPDMEVTGSEVVECGGLRFEATFRAPGGATLRVSPKRG